LAELFSLARLAPDSTIDFQLETKIRSVVCESIDKMAMKTESAERRIADVKKQLISIEKSVAKAESGKTEIIRMTRVTDRM
jgi:hypothetical protein